MQLTSGLLALALLGADGSAPEAPIVTQVRLVEMKGIEWRGAFHSKLQVVAQQGAATVWTADRAAVGEIVEAAETVTTTPKVECSARAEALVNAVTSRRYVASLGRIADGPVGKATAVAFEPHIESLQEGCRVQVSGRTIDQGVLARVDLEDTRFLHFYTVGCPETVQPKDGKGKPEKLIGQYQVPEIATSSVSGEWLIPKEGALVIGLGVHTLDKGKGKSAVCERLAVIEARPAIGVVRPGSGVTFSPAGVPDLSSATYLRQPLESGHFLASGMLPMAPRMAFHALPIPLVSRRVDFVAVAPLPPPPAPIAASALPAYRPMPKLPARGLPRGTAPDGSAAPLPPLPDPEAEAAAYEGEGSGRSSPDAPGAPPTGKTADAR